MGATNRRVRRAILDILWEEGPLTSSEIASTLASKKGVSGVPRPHSLNALLCKSSAIIPVGKKEVENLVGVKTKHLTYDVDREVVSGKDDLLYVREPCTMTPKEKTLAKKCPNCSRTRVLPEGSDECLTCARLGN